MSRPDRTPLKPVYLGASLLLDCLRWIQITPMLTLWLFGPFKPWTLRRKLGWVKRSLWTV